MQSIQATKIGLPLTPKDKIVPLSKQRNTEARHQAASRNTFVNLTNPITVEQQTAMIVHDMRSPLCIILNVLKACRKIPLEQIEQTRIALALEEAERLKRMTDETLNHARSFRESAILWCEIQLTELLREVIRLSKHLTVATDRRIIFVPNSLERGVRGDRDKLKQVFLNLLINACEAVNPGEVITVRTQLDIRTNQILIQVHNGGQSIPHHLIPVLGHQPFTTKSSGHGLGLMTVRETIAAHAGTLEIQSSEGRGTTINVQLPIDKSIGNSQPVSEISTGLSSSLSAREARILQLLVEGRSNPEIAQTLFISASTVNKHICNLMNKLGVKGRTQIAVKAIRLGLVH